MTERPAEPIDAARARELLNEAGRLGSAARAGASWPQIACLLGLGGVSTMFVVATYLVVHLDEHLIWFPMIAMGVWVAIPLTVMIVFTRASKAGFGHRWRQAIGGWGITWVVTVLGSTTWWKGELWFAITACLALTAVTTWGAWREARR